jgi:lipopolysaccharide biosynthesis glycosyltransferase
MNCIYQYWNGNLNSAAKVSRENIAKYCKYINAEYIFEHNSNWSKTISTYFDAFRPIYDDMFKKYDNVIYMDMDIFAMDNLKDNIFECNVPYVGICEEISQPWMREKYNVAGHINSVNDERWEQAVRTIIPSFKQPRDNKNRLRVFNSGVVFYSNQGLLECREKFTPFEEYVSAVKSIGRFYQLDQNYLNAQLFNGTIDTTVLDNKWNSQIHYHGQDKPRKINDERKNRACLVHLQLSGSNDFDKDTIWRTVNLPKELWNLK